MSNLTNRELQTLRNMGNLEEQAADEIDRLRVTNKMLLDDKAALQKEIALADSMYKLVVLERDAAREYLDAAQRRAESLRERVSGLEDALTHISLCSQSSMSSKEECGRVARAALKGEA